MNWWVWRFRVVLNAGFLAGSIYYLALNIRAHAGLIKGKVHLGGLSGCIYGVMACSLAAAFHLSIICWLFKKARAARAREQLEMDMDMDMDDCLV